MSSDSSSATVSSHLRRPVAAVVPSATVAEAERVAAARDAEHLLVVDAHQVVGILCRVCDLDGAPPGDPVERHMHAPLVTVTAGTSVAAAIARMREHHVGCLPVVVGGLVVGIVSRADLPGADDPRDQPDRWSCASCGSPHHLAPLHEEDGLLYCATCRERARIAADDDEVGASD